MRNRVSERLIKHFYLPCSCGCGAAFVYEQWVDDGLAFISYSIGAFESMQLGRWDRIKTAFKIWWRLAVLDKEYELYDITIEDNETLEQFKKFVSGMRSIDETD